MTGRFQADPTTKQAALVAERKRQNLNIVKEGSVFEPKLGVKVTFNVLPLPLKGPGLKQAEADG
ncbi:MAG: hypothetical protein ACQKBW_10175, partial [Puniceicoccales bacterium]